MCDGAEIPEIKEYKKLKGQLKKKKKNLALTIGVCL